MKKISFELHVSEVLLLVVYLLTLILLILPVSHNLIFAVALFGCFICALVLSIWGMISLRKVSSASFPLLLFIGFVIGAMFDDIGGSAPAYQIQLFVLQFFVGLAILMCVFSLIFTGKKGGYKVLALFLLSFATAYLLDRVFITSDEMGEKGPTYFEDEYADWRVLE